MRTGTGMLLPEQQALLTRSSQSPGRVRRVPSSWVLSASRTSAGLGRPRSPLADAQRVSITETLPPNPSVGAPLIAGQGAGHPPRRAGSREASQAERSTAGYDGPAPRQPRGRGNNKTGSHISTRRGRGVSGGLALHPPGRGPSGNTLQPTPPRPAFLPKMHRGRPRGRAAAARTGSQGHGTPLWEGPLLPGVQRG